MNKTLRYVLLGYDAVSLLDQGEALDLYETLKHAEEETLLGWVKERFGERIDLSRYDAVEKAEMTEQFRMFANSPGAHDLGIEHNGLALLAAWCFHVLQPAPRGA